jgi:hypothetical protein
VDEVEADEKLRFAARQGTNGVEVPDLVVEVFAHVDDVRVDRSLDLVK